MRAVRLDTDGDWTFGQGLSNYASFEGSIKQSITTRLKSFANDWFLDMDANVDWIAILGAKNNEIRIKREVDRVVSETDGVVKITKLELVVNRETRRANIQISVSTLFSTEIFLDVRIP